MDKTIETTFFKAFEMGGVVHMCIDWMREKYDLGYTPQPTEAERKKQLEKLPDEKQQKQIRASKRWKQYYDEILPKQIADETEVFDFSVIESGRTAKIIEEIEANLKECKDDIERERYLYTLLIPFECVAKIFHPTAEIERLRAAINECNQDKIFWDKQQDFIDANTGKKIDTKKQSKACISMAKRYQDGIDRVYHINKRFCDILGTQIHEKGTVEYYCSCWMGSASQYANRLDALLLTHGMDLIELQKKSGLYLKGYRSITDVDYYIGSMELARHYINALPSYTESKQAKITENIDVIPQKGVSGRPKRAFRDLLLCDDKDMFMQKLHNLIDGRKGKIVALFIRVCVEDGKISKPDFSEVEKEFGNIGARSGFNKYMNNYTPSKEEKDGLRAAMK